MLCQQEIICEEGVLYVDFQQEHQFKEEELRWGQLFANRASDAIKHATIYEQRRDREQLLTTLHSVAQSLASIPKKKDLLRRIGWDTLNILAADLVTIYEYIQTEKRFITPADRAGRFKAEQEMPTQIDDDDVPAKLVRETENVYHSSLVEHPIFQNSKFAQLESIKSVAGIKLKVGEEIVGVMFINYRQLHDFTSEDKKIIEILASSAAIAIKNQRWLTTRSEIDRKIITTLDRNELLNLIVEQAVKLTGADLGNIRLLDLDPSQEMLITQAKYPENTEIDPIRINTSINVGITGWVARHRKSALVDDVRGNEWKKYYIVCDPNVLSELCTPLLDKDNNFLGVLNMESRQIRAFDEKHQQILEAFADQAVIGIQNLENKDRLVKIEAMAALGHFTSSILHKVNNELGVIRTWVIKILRKDDTDSTDKLNKIVSITEKILQGFGYLKESIQVQSYSVVIFQTIIDTLQEVSIPDCIAQSVETESLQNLPPVLGTTQQLKIIFDNLIQNAVDAMPDGGTLSINGITFERDGKMWVKVQVCDTGIGIAEENLDDIFELGFTTKKNKRGMGWGLWLTKFNVERLSGRLNVNRSSGQGVIFSVILPAHNQDT
ncbi:MAG: GAF domain-containing protein [Aulosira sp. DedQUE10]|nr:GAF domain-containing protein [Aulosira sp. DedQUE10]